jgi:hypothetical protein
MAYLNIGSAMVGILSAIERSAGKSGISPLV